MVKVGRFLISRVSATGQNTSPIKPAGNVTPVPLAKPLTVSLPLPKNWTGFAPLLAIHRFCPATEAALGLTES